MSKPVKIVIHLGEDGEGPSVTADGPVELVVLRSGADLQDYQPEDIFKVPALDSATSHKHQVTFLRTVKVVGTPNEPYAPSAVDQQYVGQVFDCVQRHHAELTADHAADTTGASDIADATGAPAQ